MICQQVAVTLFHTAATVNVHEQFVQVPRVQQADNRHQYMVSSDGNRFLVATVTEQANSPITAILNWKPQP